MEKLYIKPNAKLPLADYNKTYTEIKSIYEFHVSVGYSFKLVSWFLFISEVKCVLVRVFKHEDSIVVDSKRFHYICNTEVGDTHNKFVFENISLQESEK